MSSINGRRMGWLIRVMLSAAIVTIAMAARANAAAPFSQASALQPVNPQPQAANPPDAEDPVFSKVYAQVNTKNNKVPVFATPEDAANIANPVRELNGYEWVTVIASAEISGTALSQINAGEWVRSEVLTMFRPSKFEGRAFDQPPDRPIAWVLSSFQPAVEPDGEENPNAPAYQRYDVVTIYEKVLVGTTLWYRIGDNQWCRQQRLAVVSPRRAPAGVGMSDHLHGKWISVNLFEQTIAAYEGERLVYASLVSSGLPQWETVKGVFQIQYKAKSQPMYNGARDPSLGDYYLEEVPFNMFFFQDYALHGAYWHDGFGFRHSRGCVNLSLKDAQWFFTWTQPYPSEYGYAQTEPGDVATWVWVH
jgi:hypothetical protein